MLNLSAHFVIAPGSANWWLGLAILTIVFGAAHLAATTFSEQHQTRFRKIWGVLLLLTFTATQLYLIANKRWQPSDSLPLQMCGMSNLLAIAALVWFWRPAFVPLLFWGIAGGIHSFLTPEITLGDHPLIVAEYFFSHASIMAAPWFLLRSGAFKLSATSWLHALLWNNLALLPIGLLNLLLNANYMYLCIKPLAENPFVVGDWPWYILGFEAAAIVHYFLLHLAFRRYRVAQS